MTKHYPLPSHVLAGITINYNTRIGLYLSPQKTRRRFIFSCNVCVTALGQTPAFSYSELTLVRDKSYASVTTISEYTSAHILLVALIFLKVRSFLWFANETLMVLLMYLSDCLFLKPRCRPNNNLSMIRLNLSITFSQMPWPEVYKTTIAGNPQFSADYFF